MTDAEWATITDLAARLDRFDGDGAAAVLLDAAAHHAAQELYAAVLARTDPGDAPALLVLGRWFLHRYGSLPPGSGQSDLRSARLCAGLLRDLDPAALTDDLHELLAGRVDHAVRTHETALSMLDEFDSTGDHDRVAIAADLLGTLEDSLAEDHPLRGELPNAAALLAVARFTIRADPADLAEMVAAARRAVDLGNSDTLPDKVCTLAYALAMTFERSGDLAELDEAQRILEPLLRDRGQLLPNVAATLANVLRMRSERTRSIADLDRAVALCREAAAGLPSGHPLHAQILQNLGFCLIRRVERLDRADDLTAAIEVLRQVQPTIGPGGPVRAMWAANLAGMLTWRARRGGSPRDLDEAVALNREALALSERLHGIRRMAHQNLATALVLRHAATNSRADLTESIAHLRAAVSGQPGASGPVHAMLAWVSGLASAEDGDLDTVIAAARQALVELPSDHPERATALVALAEAHHQRFLVAGDHGDLATAIDMWRTVCTDPIGKAETRVLAARSWLDAAVHARDLGSAAEAATVAVGLLPVLAGRELDRAGQERRLAGVAGLAGNAAALAVELGRPEHAVELVEQGRAVLWSQAVQTRGDLSTLRSVAPGLASRLEVTRRAINRAARSGTEPDRYRELVARWDTLLAQARALPGFAAFLDTPPFAELSTAAAGGSVVVVNMSGPRCDALIVRPGDVRVVPLPWLSRSDAHHRADALLSALAEARDGAAARANLRQTLTALLRWLWDTVAAPVLDELDAMDGVRGHRVWWCPTGPLALLPLHAAGRYTSSPRWADRRRPTVPDRTVSSYTTGLRPLLRTRQAGRVSAPALLAVGLPDTPGRARLPAVVEELRRIADAVPGTRTLIGPQATPDAVLAELHQHPWAHFACHATHHIDRPGEGALHLSGGDLSVLRLAAHELDGADFAYLSACQTAGGAPALADETVNLAAALQLAGYRHVIGTLWPVDDPDAAVVAESVYRRLTAGGRPDSTDAAAALSAATRELRARCPDRPDAWASFVHLGP